MTMIERVARAMAIKADWEHWDTAIDGQDTPSGNDPEDERNYFRDQARAAIEAMMEPDTAMRDAWAESLVSVSWEQAEYLHRAMLQTALDENIDPG